MARVTGRALTLCAPGSSTGTGRCGCSASYPASFGGQHPLPALRRLLLAEGVRNKGRYVASKLARTRRFKAHGAAAAHP